MKKSLIIFILLLSNAVLGQGEANNWFFGHNAGIEFDYTNGTVTNISNPLVRIRTEEGCSAFSDPNGNLLFYSDGSTVWNKNHLIMDGGSNLKGNPSSTQSAMIIPKPMSSTEFYIFTVGAYFNTEVPGFNYYTIDMSLNGGLGKVVGGPTDLSGPLSLQWTEKVAAVKGAQCNTNWVISYDGNNLKAYMVDPSGVNTTPVSSFAPAPTDGDDRRGYLKVSPDGKKIAIAHFLYTQDNPIGNSSVIIYDFDDSTGKASNPVRVFNDPSNFEHAYGLEFSRQSTKLYASTFDGINNRVYQYDLTNSDVANSAIMVQNQIGYRGALQLGPDGKIYATVPVDYWTGTQFLDVINAPDELGINCDYQQDVINLGTGMATQGLPPFLSSIFSPIEITGNDGSGNSIVLNGQLVDLCLGDDLTISPETISGTATYEWTFNGNVVSTTEDLVLTNIQLSNIGDYNLEVTSVDACGRTSFRNGNFSIQSVNEPPIAYPVTTQIVCDPLYTGTFAFDFDTMYSSVVLNGQDPNTFEVKYFSSQADADANTNELPVPFDSPNISIFARIQNINNNNCFDTTSFDITIYQSALPLNASSIPPMQNCDNISYGTLNDGINITDLTVYQPLISNGQNPTDFPLTYYTDAAYSISIPDPTAFQNSVVGGQTIYVRSTNQIEPTCFTDTQFELEIFTTPTPIQPSNMILCDDDNNGTMSFDLTSQNALINTESGMVITYHASQNDADLNLNPIISPHESGVTTIYVRVENTLHPSCYDTTSFGLEVYDSAFPLDSASITSIAYCDNTSVGTDTDGIIVFDLTERSIDILNGQAASEFTLTYFTASNYDPTSEILDPINFQNTVVGGQTIYVRMTNNLESSCYSDTSFTIEVFELPVIQPTMIFKNCDEDGNPDGFTDYNLEEANAYITNGATDLTVTYHLSMIDADTGSNAVNPSPFNNVTAATVYARVETVDGCHRVSTVSLEVSTTSFPAGYSYTLETCDDDDTIDGLHLFDLTQASSDMIAQFPSGQNLSVHYYTNQNDAQLEQNEIVSQSDYMSETPFNQTLYVRVESNDNGACFGVGPFLELIVYERPEFEVIPEAVVCLNLPPIILEVFNPKDVYTYEWTDENNQVISTETTVEVSVGGVYTVIATSGLNCESFPQTVTVIESDIAVLDHDDVTITDDSSNNTITINNENNNLGLGDYEFALDDELGPYQDESLFEQVMPGLHTIYVRDKNGCGLAMLEVSVIGFPKFFTPNDDGFNDTWTILGVSRDFYPTSLIYIYDRFGKILAKVDPLGEGWNGFYNGTELPSDDYWFSVELIDKNGETRNRKGNFSLIRR
ncbi:T9SS type B sorting domain-containing protein [Urechidicola vernalis]|uniref:T9SS type B sorting domain-containing protein n=1 Tax=Urechidicola vernalis TaxID=3075600 RepID=A0ABU2Y2S6_9FLAO|nr:T9SS type B sorting domain-containing protein [Urechidicola sp. P050]MDT0552501.1 T9SS type B sorting domain-containing protein [Urechidicola sp. P050]